MGAVTDFFVRVWISFFDLRPIEQLLAVLSVAAALLPLIAWAYRRGRRIAVIQEQMIESLHEERKLHRAQIVDLEEQISSLERAIPHSWLRSAERERRDGNDDLAIEKLRDGFEAIAWDLHHACIQLAQYHMSMLVDGEENHLKEARRFAVISNAIAHSNDMIQAILEIDLLVSVNGDMIQSNWAELRTGHSEDAAFFPALGDASALIVDEILSVARQLHYDGLFVLAERAVWRARYLANRDLGKTHRLTLLATLTHARTLNFIDANEEAYDLMRELLPACVELWGPLHPDTLSAKYYTAASLSGLGRTREALAATIALLPEHEMIKGKLAQDTLATRQLEATLLATLGQAQEALGKEEDLITDAYSVEHSVEPGAILKARTQMAWLLRDLARYEEALTKAQAIISEAGDAFGRKHPKAFNAPLLEILLLLDLNRASEGLEKIDTLLLILENEHGVGHSATLEPRHVRTLVLQSLGRRKEALEVAQSMIGATSTTRRIPKRLELNLRLTEVDLLSELGLNDDATSKLEPLLSDFDQVFGQASLKTQTLLYIQARTTASLGRHDLAQSQASALLALQRAHWGSSHPHTERTARLLTSLKSDQANI